MYLRQEFCRYGLVLGFGFPENLSDLPGVAVIHSLDAVDAADSGLGVRRFSYLIRAPQMRHVAVLVDRILDLVLIESFVAALRYTSDPVVEGEDMRGPRTVR